MIPGQPPSVNHSYKPVMIQRYTASGQRYSRIGMAKQTAVLDYQTGVVRITQTSKPAGWRPVGEYIRITYAFFLKRSIDCDNAMKALNDALAMAIGVDDKWFLPCVVSKSVDGKERNPRVEVTIDL